MFVCRGENVVGELLSVGVRVVCEKGVPVGALKGVVQSVPVGFVEVVYLACVYVSFGSRVT